MLTVCCQQVAAVVQGVLGVAVPPAQPLMEAGLDSLGAVELRNALGTRFGIELAPTVTFDYPSIVALAGHLATKPGLAASAPDVSSPAVPQRALVQRQHRHGRPRQQTSLLVSAPPQSQVRLTPVPASHAET